MEQDEAILLRILNLLRTRASKTICVLNADALNTDTQTALSHIDWLLESGCINPRPNEKYPFEVYGGLTEKGISLLKYLAPR